MKLTISYKYDVGDLVTVTKNTSGHSYPTGHNYEVASIDTRRKRVILQDVGNPNSAAFGTHISHNDLLPTVTGESRKIIAKQITETIIPMIKASLERFTATVEALTKYKTTADEIADLISKVSTKPHSAAEITEILAEFGVIEILETRPIISND